MHASGCRSSDSTGLCARRKAPAAHLQDISPRTGAFVSRTHVLWLKAHQPVLALCAPFSALHALPPSLFSPYPYGVSPIPGEGMRSNRTRRIKECMQQHRYCIALIAIWPITPILHSTDSYDTSHRYCIALIAI